MAQPGAWELRPISPADFEWAYELHRLSVGPYVEETWGWDESLQRRMFTERFAHHDRKVVEVDGHDVGVVATDERPDELFLAVIELLPAWQGKGIGTNILRYLLRRARDTGRPLGLHVLKANPRAAALYYEREGLRRGAVSRASHQPTPEEPAQELNLAEALDERLRPALEADALVEGVGVGAPIGRGQVEATGAVGARLGLGRCEEGRRDARAAVAPGHHDGDEATGGLVLLQARHDVGGDEARDLAAGLGHDHARQRVGREAGQPGRDRRLGRRVPELVEQRGDRRGVGGRGVADGQSAVVTGPVRSRSRS
jgi:GNAT superfamily N-acetyltransferase